nr:glycoside hydrolase family 3 protein [Desulfobulbaceae bacterium]
MVGVPGLELDDSTRQLINQDKIHNFILFRRNVGDKKQLQRLCADLKKACLDSGLPAPLISIDQEGGSVARLAAPFTVFPDQRLLAEDVFPEDKLREYAITCARELRELGVNMNLAPVLDVCPRGKDLFMERRCLGNDPERVAELGVVVIKAMQGERVAACAKHFPGLGMAELDPHLDLPVVDLPRSRFNEVELVPFRRAKEAGVAAFMTSHAVYSDFDEGLPGTLSREIVHGFLRGKLGYQGLVITDDLEMGAIEQFMPFAKATLQSFVAGADLLLACHDHEKIRVALKEMRRALEGGLISKEAISISLHRQVDVLDMVA